MDKIKTETIEAILDNVVDDELRQDAYKELNRLKDELEKQKTTYRTKIDILKAEIESRPKIVTCKE